MPLQHSLWLVGDPPRKLPASRLESEQKLHRMIEESPALISEDLMLIGSEQEAAEGRFDLLAVAPDASLILVELKRDRTPRDVVAQALDYASWVEALAADEIREIYGKFRPGQDLSADFRTRFGIELDEDELNNSHQIIIVAAELDAASERIVQYLSEHGISINVLFFQVFDDGEKRLISRAWMVDPGEVQSSAAGSSRGRKEPWNGEYYISFGTDDGRSWEEARQLGFVSAGGGSWYTRTLAQLKTGDRIWVNVPGTGYVGVGKVTGPRQPARDFRVEQNGVLVPVLDVVSNGHYHRDEADDDEKCEYFVPVKWSQTVAEAHAVKELGFFGNQNTVAAPRSPKWRTTVETLRTHFPDWDG